MCIYEYIYIYIHLYIILHYTYYNIGFIEMCSAYSNINITTNNKL